MPLPHSAWLLSGNRSIERVGEKRGGEWGGGGLRTAKEGRGWGEGGGVCVCVGGGGGGGEQDFYVHFVVGQAARPSTVEWYANRFGKCLCAKNPY